VTTILLAWATTLIFTSAFGVGSVMAIGVIMLPILFSLGVPKRVAIASYTMSIASGMYLNLGYVKQIQALFPSVPYDAAYVKVALILTGIHMAVILAFIVFSFRNGQPVRAWAASPQPGLAADAELGSWVFLIPAIPIALIVGLKWQPIPSLMVAMLISMLLTKKLRSYKEAVAVIQQTLYDGVADVGLLIGMLFAIVMFAGAAAKVSPILGKIFGPVLPHDPMILAIAFGLFAPLALFRGPLMVFGSGGATLAILLSMNIFSPKFLFALIMIPPVAMVANTCPTQSWSMWAINYSKLPPQDYLKTGLVWSWLLMLINEVVAVYLFS
ncbi:MAG TPA: citrate transporter, partial [Negativicutes bacterium]|nr:citrate transporter [Negativicutes bacterium]